MLCPNDNQLLVTKSKKGLTVSECPECNGVWLPNSSLSRPHLQSPPSASKQSCPMCASKMDDVRFKGYPVHRCNDCQHVWIEGAAIQSLLETKRKNFPKLDFLPSYNATDLIFDILFYAPDLVIESAKGLASVTESAGEAVVEFFGDLLSDIF